MQAGIKWNPSKGRKMSHRTDTAIGDVYCQSQYCVYSHYNAEKISHRNALSIGCRNCVVIRSALKNFSSVFYARKISLVNFTYVVTLAQLIRCVRLVALVRFMQFLWFHLFICSCFGRMIALVLFD